MNFAKIKSCAFKVGMEFNKFNALSPALLLHHTKFEEINFGTELTCRQNYEHEFIISNILTQL